jgi:hypothetical protein
LLGDEAAGAAWLIGPGGREEGSTDAGFRINARAGKPATGMTRHLIDVIVKARPPARKV